MVASGGGCSAAAIDHARPLPPDVTPFVARGRGDIDPELAADLGRFRAAVEDAVLLCAPWRERKTDRRILYGAAYIAGAAGRLENFPAALRTLGHVAGVTVDTLRGTGGAVARILRGYPDLIQRPAVGGIAADGLRSSRWTLTPPADGAELAAPAIMPGSNAARAMSESKRGRSDLWRLCSAWPDDGAAAMSAADAAACVPGWMHSTTARRRSPTCGAWRWPWPRWPSNR